jgi:hypothetical protein
MNAKTEQPQAQPLNGQQMAELSRQYSAQLSAIRKDIELRKYALEHACRHCDAGEGGPRNVLELAKQMHEFLISSIES